MPDYRPIPGQEMMESGPSSNMPMDDLTMMARERASNLLMPYAAMGGMAGVSTGSPGVGSPASTTTTATPAATPGTTTASPLSPGIEDKLYQAVHPDTLNKILEMIMQFVTGKPIPRELGGSVDPNEEYIVGENGPEKFKSDVPGQIIPQRPIPGPSGSMERREPPSFGERARETFVDPYANIAKSAYGGYQKYIGEPFARAAGLVTEPIVSDVRYLATGERPSFISAPEIKALPPGAPRPWAREAAGHGRPIPTAGGVGGEGEDLASTRFDPSGGVDWTAGGTGYGGWTERETPETIRGDEQARQRILQEAGQGGFKPIPGQYYGGGYYAAHPEERDLDALINQYGIGDPRTGEITNLKELTDIHKSRMQFGVGTPASQERIARADYERAEAEAKRANIPFEQYLKSAEAQKNLGEAAKTDYISGKWGVYHVPTGQFMTPPGETEKPIAKQISKLREETDKETMGDPVLSNQRMREKVKAAIGDGTLKKGDLPPNFFKLTKTEFMQALQKAKKIPQNATQEQVDMAYRNYLQIPIED